MVSPFRVFHSLIYVPMVASLLTGCVSYRFMRATQGKEVPPVSERCQAGKTTLTQVLETLGAPDGVAQVEGEDVLVYKRSIVANSGLSFGIPFSDLLSLDFSGSGTLIRYDVLLLFFTPNGLLSRIVSEKGSDHAYLKTIFDDKKGD